MSVKKIESAWLIYIYHLLSPFKLSVWNAPLQIFHGFNAQGRGEPLAAARPTDVGRHEFWIQNVSLFFFSRRCEGGCRSTQKRTSLQGEATRAQADEKLILMGSASGAAKTVPCLSSLAALVSCLNTLSSQSGWLSRCLEATQEAQRPSAMACWTFVLPPKCRLYMFFIEATPTSRWLGRRTV